MIGQDQELENKAALERLHAEEKQLKQDYGFVFGGPEGQRVFNDLVLRFCHLFEPSVIQGGDINDILIREGERNVGLYIIRMLGPEFEHQLVQEVTK